MSLDTATKKQIMADYATVEGDTGSPEVQVALLTTRISTSPSTSRRTSTTTTAGAACCCWSAGAVGCCKYLARQGHQPLPRADRALGLRR